MTRPKLQKPEPDSPRTLVAQESPNRIRDHLGRTATSYNPTNSLNALTGQITLEYEDRFLVELLQNAYDANERGTSTGRVCVLLDESEPDGAVLYVANSGHPFTRENFDAITNVAQSSKPVGQGIGNKGVGFRSVLQVCPSPEIYSVAPEGAPSSGDAFDGFCFGFASDAQIREMVGNEEDFVTVSRDFSRYLLPVIAEPTDPLLPHLRAQGMVSVVKLPLKAPSAVTKVRSQLAELETRSAPVALFLDRLASISLERVDGTGARTRSTIKRQERKVDTAGSDVTLSEVLTGDRRFLVTTRVLPAAEICAVISSAITAGELDATWDSWNSDVEVSLAASLSSDAVGRDWPSSYTYLPMRTRSPLRAHLHAPFHTRLARLDLNESSCFNAHLLEVAARLAVETVRFLTSDGGSAIDLATRQSAAVDLMIWDDDHEDLLESACDRLDEDLREVAFVPTEGPNGAGWQGLDRARTWRATGTEFVTREQLVAHVELVDGSIGAERLSHLYDTRQKHLGRGTDPSDEELATWVELCAGSLSTSSGLAWGRFLGEVAELFAGRDAKALQRRRIILDGSGKLRRCGPWQEAASKAADPTLFILPMSAGAADADEESDVGAIPKNLQRTVAFLHKDIAVRRTVKGRRETTPVGDLLSRGSLVEAFELTTVLQHIRRLLSGAVNDRTRLQALSWVYAQERASRSPIADLARYELRVPTEVGWVRASEAVFSAGWGTERGVLVAQLLVAAGDTSETLNTVRDRTIKGPEAWPSKIRDRDGFRDFLARCGVRDGLMPLPLRARPIVRMNGSNFEPRAIALRHGLENAEPWATHVDGAWEAHFAGPQTPYSGMTPLWTVPGHDALSALSNNARELLAAAVLGSLTNWPEAVWSYRFQRRSQHHLTKPDPQLWPSPVATFLEREAWFPMADPGRRDTPYFVQPAAAWSFDEGKDETAPRFARLAPKPYRQQLTLSQGAAKRLSAAGLQVWNDAASAQARLAELARLIDSEALDSRDASTVRKAVVRAWSELSSQPVGALPNDLRLVIARGASLRTLLPSSEDPCDVFVVDASRGLATQVLEAAGAAVLVADGRAASWILRLLADLPGVRPRATSSAQAQVFLDAVEINPANRPGELLVDVFSTWIVPTLLTVIELRANRFTPVNERVLRESENRLRQMRLVTGNTITLSLDGKTVKAAGRLATSVHLADPIDPTLILATGRAALPSWPAMADLADDIAELLSLSQTGSEIRAAALELGTLISDWRQPSESELAQVLRCDPHEVSEVRSGRQSSADELRGLMLPFVAVSAGHEVARLLGDEPIEDVAALASRIRELMGVDGEAVLEAASSAETVAKIRILCDTDLIELNAALRELGREPLNFAELHVELLAAHINEHRTEILADVRQRFFRRFEQRADLSAYVSARDLRIIGPDPAWAESYERVPEPMLAARVDEWLDDLGGDASTVELDAIDAVRERNVAAVRSALPRAKTLVRAYSRKQNKTLPDAWDSISRIGERLRVAGCLDFRPLSDDEMMSWLDVLDLLPLDMSATTNLLTLGLQESDFDDAPPGGATPPEPRPGILLRVGQRTFDVTQQLDALVEEVITSIPHDFYAVDARPTALVPPPESRQPTAGDAASLTPRTYGGSKQTGEQAAAIGRAGEELAYEWLKNKFGREATPDSWVSSNRTRLGGHDGNDGLGYDFRIERRQGRMFFEVKATKTALPEFEMGESELRMARSAPKGTYRIIFISSVLTPGEQRLRVLPNPFERGQEASYKQVGSGIRLRFNRPS